ncbi:MAG TPA: DUF4139 domain-containing protein [Flavobacteriales bacterium]|nr:DUF4139 domain-containing protein [Flavobacteriales bacterium]
MRLASILLTSVLAPSSLLAAEGEKPIASKLTEAKVFLSGAQVTRTASATVPAGTSVLVFTGLAEGLDPQSIQVTGKGGYQILSVNHRINYLTESPKKKEIEDLQTRMKKLDKDWAYEKAMQDVWVNEEQLLNKNSAIGGQQNGLTAAQLTAVNDYIRQRLITTKTNWLAQQEKLTSIQEEKQKLAQQMQQYQAQAPRPTSEVVVEISSTLEVSASFTLNYFAGGAGWIPAYDLRAKGVGQPIELLMKAQVTNSTGEDWSKVALSLSSGNPTLGGVMPALNPWTLYTYRPRMLQEVAVRRSRAKGDMPMAAPSTRDSDERLYQEQEASTIVANTVAYRTTTTEFVIETPFTIPADGKAHTVGVKSHSITASYRHYATPKLDKDAFLYARTTGWEDLNLLPGQANVFFEGTFVGESYLQLDLPKDTLDISLGRDKGVVVERVKRKTTNEKAIVGGKRTITVGWDLTVRNTKGTAVDLEVRDQYPLSPQSEIEVKLTDKGGATVDDQKGLLTWNQRIEPKATKKLGFSYEVKHPKDLPVVVE